MFVHIGVLHLLMNMYALYSIGTFLEPILGRALYLVAYLSSGILSGLCSFWFHKDSLTISAGASGAIAGIFGVSIFVLLASPMPKMMRDKALKGVMYVILMNVGYGLVSGINIDHSAHIGGLVSGLLVGALFYPVVSFPLWMQRTRLFIRRSTLKWISGSSTLILTCALVPAILINQHPSDNLSFLKLLREYYSIEEDVSSYFEKIDPESDHITLFDVCNDVLPKIKKAKALSSEFATFSLSGKEDLLRNYYVQYIDLYDQRFHFIMLSCGGSDRYDVDIMQIDNKIKKLNKTFESALAAYK